MKDRSSRIGVGCLMLFATPFVAVGLISGVIAIPELSRGSQRENAWLLPIFSLTFLIAGLSIAGMALYAGRALRRQEELRARHPQSPWMWRPEWQSGRITYRGGASALTLWVLAILWNLISSPLFFFLPGEVRKGNNLALIGFLFPLIGLFLLFNALKTTLRHRKFGTSTLVLPRHPIQPGESLSAHLETTVDRERIGTAEFLARMTCLRKITTGSGKSRSTSEEIQWREEDRVPAARIAPGPGGATVPIVFHLPAELPESSRESSDNEVVWRLDVSAVVPGIDYAATFDLPVFRTGEASFVRAAPVSPAFEAGGPLPRNVAQRPRGDGALEYVVKPAPGSGSFFLFFFLLIWWAVVAVLIRFSAPFIFPIVFGLFGILLIWAFIDWVFGTSEILVRGGTVEIVRRWLFVRTQRVIPANEIRGVNLKIGMQQGGGSGTPYYDLVFETISGKKLIAGKHFRQKREAESLAAKLREALKLPSAQR